MDLDQLVDAFHLRDQAGVVRDQLNRLPPDAPADWCRLATVLALRHAARGGERKGARGGEQNGARGGERKVAVLGISGGQGAGKTTLSTLLVRALELCGCRAVALSLDDFYLPGADRQRLAATVHPLLATRGVPRITAVRQRTLHS